MMNGDGSHQVVLGAGPLGVSLADRLEKEGKQVQLYSIMNNSAYDMIGTQPKAIDGADPDLVKRVCQGAEVIFLCLNAHYVDWHRQYAPRLEAAIRAASANGARFIYHDNLYMYGPVDGAINEETARSATSRKGMLRRDMADRVIEASRSGMIRAAVGRSPDMYGPGALNSSFNSTLGQRHFYPALAGRTVSVLGDIDAPHAYAFVDDVAKGLIALAQNEEALDQVWHLPAAPTLSHRQLISLIFEEAGHRLKIRGSRISSYFVRGIGLFQKDVAEVAEMLYEFEKPLEFDHGKFTSHFMAEVTPHREAIKQTAAWYRKNPLD